MQRSVVIRRIAEVQRAAAARGDLEAQWLAAYTAQLMREASRVVEHFDRLSGPDFHPRLRLERALNGDKLDGG